MSFLNYIEGVSLIGVILNLLILHKYYKNIPAPFLVVYSLAICVTGFITSIAYHIFKG